MKCLSDNPDFQPMFTPYEMLELGIFDGSYYKDTNPDFERKPVIKMTNLFEANASQPREVWEQKGWIKEHDPMGWFQWYVRYYQGRRIEGYDDWQINRWKSFIARHGAQVRKNGNGDLTKRRKQRQSLLHWASDPIPDVDMSIEDKFKLLQSL